jgi:CheY-like chemotaxis protein
MTDHGPILVVDDDAAIRSAVRDVLESEGLSVETASNGADALEKVRRV